MKKKVISLLIVLYLFTIFSDSMTDVNSLAEEAVAFHPEIEMLKKQIEALDKNIAASRIVRDPIISIEYSSMPINAPYPGEHAMSGIQFKFLQTLPFPGKNDKREGVAKQVKLLKLIEIKEWENRLIEKVKQSYWNLSAIRLLREVDRNHITLIEKLILVVKAGYESGITSQYNLLRLEVLKEKLLDGIGDYNRNERILTASINSSTNSAYDKEIKTPHTILLLQNTKTLESLKEKSRKLRPLLQVWREKAKLEIKKAERVAIERKPDFTFWTGYRIRVEAGPDEGINFLSLGFSMPIPFDYTGRAKSKESYFRYTATSHNAKFNSLLSTITYNLEESLAIWDRAYEQTLSYENKIIPTAKKSLEAALSSYQVGKSDFESLYHSELLLMMLEKKVILSKTKTQLMHVKIEMLTGEENNEE